MVLKVANVGIALEEPQQFVDDGADVKFLCRQQGETVLQRKAHLPAKNRQRPRAGAVGLAIPVLEHVAHEVKVLAHVRRVLKNVEFYTDGRTWFRWLWALRSALFFVAAENPIGMTGVLVSRACDCSCLCATSRFGLMTGRAESKWRCDTEWVLLSL